MLKNINKHICKFSTISLEEMNSVALMKRTDTKFIINTEQLKDVLKRIRKQYQILEIENKRLMNYSSLYFDTTNKQFYKDHHNGKVNRTKIRMRKYVDSDLCFLEIKQKDGKGNTNKSRMKILDFETELSKSNTDFIEETTFQKYQLKPTLWNGFKRITLVNLENEERITIDLNLSYSINKIKKKYDDLVIIELKQKRFNRASPIVKVLKSIKAHPYSISKYCIGIINMYPDLKYNIFKKKIIKINKITT